MILQKPPPNLYRLYNLCYSPEDICGMPPVNVHFGRFFPFFKLCNVNLSPNERPASSYDPFLSGDGLTWFWDRLGFVRKGRPCLCGPCVGLGEWGFRFPGLPAGLLGNLPVAVLITHRLFVVQNFRVGTHRSGTHCLRRRGIMIIILNIEYQSVCPFVRIGFPGPLSRKRVCPPPPETKGRKNTRWRVRGLGEQIRTTGEKAWHTVYSVVKGMERSRTFVWGHIVLASFRWGEGTETEKVYNIKVTNY